MGPADEHDKETAPDSGETAWRKAGAVGAGGGGCRW